MKTIYALIASIDNYPIPAHQLNGCVNDARAFSEYLKKFADANALPIKTVELFDEKATRQGIIKGFAHFDAAKEGDMCVFYYSGHGSQMPAPKEFWDESDGMSETMVCYDSRLPKGRDLADKELGYLIWKASGGKDLHFLVVTDCCHSGTITRDLTVKSRMADPAVSQVKAREYLGFAEYVKSENSLQPPAARHVHLAAAKDDETAKEYGINGEQRGVFTYSLVEVLESTGGRTTYASLMEAVNAKVQNRVKEQSPQFSGHGFQNKTNLSFLGDDATQTAKDYLLTFDKNWGWIVKAGALQGIPTAGATFRTADDTLLTTKQVHVNHAVVTGTDEMARDTQHRVQLESIEFQRTRIGISADSDAAGEALIRKGWSDQRMPLLEWVENPDTADYWIRAYNGSFRLTTLTSEVPLFRRVKEYSLPAVYAFLEDVDRVANFDNRKRLQNPNTKLPKEYITVTVTNEAKEEVNAPYVFRQAESGVETRISVSVQNTSPRALWVSFLGFGVDYSITNQYLPKRHLKSGQIALIEVNNQPNIPLLVPEELLSWGVSEIDESFRIFVSSDEPNTDPFNQDGLKLDLKIKGDRPIGIGKATQMALNTADWCVIDVPYTLISPMPEHYLQQNRAVALTEWMSVQAPKGFVATATLSADTPAQQSGAKKATRKMRGSSKVALNEGLANAPSLNVLELKGIQGKLSEANPLKINIQNIEKDDHVIALQYDEKSGLYFPVGRSVDGVIHITDTPQVAQDVATRSLFGTVKILFQKLIVSKLTGEFEYPLLRMAQFESNQDEKFTYVNDLKSIESAIESAENIVLFIHGMVGDTGEMTKSVIRAKKKEKPLLDNYQLVLTFDYDSVSTPIEETAKDLKARLEALGLVAGHGRKLDIIAHSIGGLVSRYFIEKLEGNQVVTRLIQLGVPNNGTEITQLKDVIKTYSMLAINGLPALQPWMTPLTLFANYLVKNIQVTIDQLKPTSDLLKKLNDGSDPGIPYHIIAGNTRLIKKTYPKETTFIQKVYENLKSQGLYYILEQSLFKSDNDLVVRTESAKSIAGKEAWANPVTEVEIANDHLSYFYKPEGLKALVDVVYGKKP
ncbi:MAG: hypothetical protein RL329_354 [Bacteroidota bacterium]